MNIERKQDQSKIEKQSKQHRLAAGNNAAQQNAVS